jgi:hypothetical protein
VDDPFGIMGHETIHAVLCRLLLQTTIWVANMHMATSCSDVFFYHVNFAETILGQFVS